MLDQNKIFKLMNRSFRDLVLDAVSRIHRSGKTFYVDSNTGSSSNTGTRLSSPLATIQQAINKCTASQGDQIIVLPQHAETVTSTMTVPAGVRIQGLRCGNLKPVITINGATDLFNLSGANAYLGGFHFLISTTDAATAFINLAAAKCYVDDISALCSASSVNVEDCITVASGADDCLIENIDFRNTTVPVNSFLSIEAAVARLTVKKFHAFGDVATGGVIDAATATQVFFEDWTIGVVGSSKPAVTLDSNPTGFAHRIRVSGTSTTLATNGNFGNVLRSFDVQLLEETDNSKQGAQIPAVDAD